jgi:LPXTG-site transpeptidase (sortase) family protein
MSKRHFRKQITSLRAQLIAGLALLIIGLVTLGSYWLNTDHLEKSATKPKPTNQVIKNTKPVQNSQAPISGTPTHISIPSVGIDLNVIPGYYYPSSNSWTLSLNNAQWGTMTAPANNQSGNTFIYAHARIGVFASLPKVKTGDQAIITTDNGHSFTYSFNASTVTTPTDTSLFGYKGKPILILQTCTGAWYQNRQLFVFDLGKVS